MDRKNWPSSGFDGPSSTATAVLVSLARDAQPALSFAGFRLETDDTLLRDGRVVHLPPKEVAALRLLLARAGQVVSPLELKSAVWGDVHVAVDSISQCLSSLRAHLDPEECIQTVYKRGYRFVAKVDRDFGASANLSPRLAILPFSTSYAIPEHLGHAIAEETIVRLANMQGFNLALLARDSVFTLAERGCTARQIGMLLKANLVLTGSLRALPGRMLLRAEMIRVEDDTQIWIEDLVVPADGVANLETNLVNRLVSRLHALPGLSISAAAEPELAPQQREAFEIFQRARYEGQTLERHRMQDGLQCLTHAAELDPSLIAAKIELAHLCVGQSLLGFMSPTVAAELIHRTADSIPDLIHQAEAILPARGWVSFHAEHNLSAALWAFSNSSSLLSNPWVTRVRAMFALGRHRFAEAIDLLSQALRNDPYSPWLHNRLAWAFHLAGQASLSMEQIEEAIVRFSEHEGTSLYGAIILAFNGKPARAVALAQQLSLRLPYFDLAQSVLAYALACAGQEDEANAILERLQWLSRERFVLKSFNPAAYVALGDLENAMAQLQAAQDDRCPWFFQMLADPRLEPLYSCPDFIAMKSVLAAMEASVTGAIELND